MRHSAQKSINIFIIISIIIFLCIPTKSSTMGSGVKKKIVEAAGYITAAGVISDDVYGNIISVTPLAEGEYQLVLDFKSRCELVTATHQRNLGTLVVNTISDVLDADDHFYAERLTKDVDTLESGECNPTTVIALKTRDDFNGPLQDRDFNFYYVAGGQGK